MILFGLVFNILPGLFFLMFQLVGHQADYLLIDLHLSDPFSFLLHLGSPTQAKNLLLLLNARREDFLPISAYMCCLICWLWIQILLSVFDVMSWYTYLASNNCGYVYYVCISASQPQSCSQLILCPVLFRFMVIHHHKFSAPPYHHHPVPPHIYLHM